MLWTQDTDHLFAGIIEKLKRTYENLGNLKGEADTFFKGSKYPIMPDANSEEWQEALDYHRALVIPKRFSVLGGEIVHHLRSCLDHVAWHFSSAAYRIKAENAIEFPAYRTKPVTKQELGRYERKIKGITNPRVLSFIEQMQPYQRGNNAANDPLCVVHDMDRFDKHRELMIVGSCANAAFAVRPRFEVVQALLKYSQGEPLTIAESSLARNAVKQDAVVFPQIAFPEFGKRKNQPVIPSLLQLHEAIFKAVELFADLV